MTFPIEYQRNDLHPTALYLRESDWTAGRVDIAALSHTDCIANGIKRLRIILGADIEPPAGWQNVKQTLIRRVSVGQFSAPMGQAIAVQQGDPNWDDWIAAHWDFYRDGHSDNPVAHLSVSEREMLFAGPDMDDGMGFGIWQDGKIMAFSSLRHGPLGPEVAEVGWTHALGRNSNPLLTEVVSKVARSAAKVGVQFLELEADSNDVALWDYVRELPSTLDDWSATWELRS